VATNIDLFTLEYAAGHVCFMEAATWSLNFKYSTHQTIRYTPLFLVHSYGTTCPRKAVITFERLGLDFFSFFPQVDEKMIYIFYAHENIIGLFPIALVHRSLY
jgi:hypothetical protein